MVEEGVALADLLHVLDVPDVQRVVVVHHGHTTVLLVITNGTGVGVHCILQ